jgi:hypothetical protein
MIPLGMYLQAFFSINYWHYTILKADTRKSALSTIGSIWLILSIARFFVKIPDSVIANNWSIFLLVVVLLTFKERRPVISVSEKLPERDVELEIKLGNLFREKGAKVISINTTFDTDIDNGVISKDSLQGQFTEKFYKSVQDLDKDIDSQLSKHSPVDNLDLKECGKTKRYELGTVVQVRPKGKIFYLAAIADFNNKGVASSSFDKLKLCLEKIWQYVSECGETDPIVIPLMGSGRARLTETREIIAQEIINSFIEACASKKFCRKLTIIISPHDYQKYDLNLYELRDYLKFRIKQKPANN